MFFQDKGHTKSLKEFYSYNCLYCSSCDYWYSDCKSFWEDVHHGRIAALPLKHDKRGSKYTPPSCTMEQCPQHSHPAQTHQSNGSIQKIDVPEANDGTVLLDSGSTINVSGMSKFFTITSKLQNPLTVSFAISKFMAPINSIGYLRIPTPLHQGRFYGTCMPVPQLVLLLQPLPSQPTINVQINLKSW